MGKAGISQNAVDEKVTWKAKPYSKRQGQNCSSCGILKSQGLHPTTARLEEAAKGIIRIPVPLRPRMGKKTKIPTAASSSSRSNPTFPSVSHKDHLTCRVLLEDQIMVVDVSGGLNIRTKRRLIVRRIFSPQRNASSSYTSWTNSR